MLGEYSAMTSVRAVPTASCRRVGCRLSQTELPHERAELARAQGRAKAVHGLQHVKHDYNTRLQHVKHGYNT